MNDAWAVVIGALVGAAASLGATALGLLPGLNPEDRSQRIARRAQLEQLLADFTRDLMTLALSLDDAESRRARIEVRGSMMVTRVKLASLVSRRGDKIMSLFDVAMQAAQRNEPELRTRAGALFSVGASLWLRGERFPAEVRRGMSDLSRKTAASIAAADAEENHAAGTPS
ncbi:MAG: hypothetical protein V4737_08765 [Curtobacterium sp.]